MTARSKWSLIGIPDDLGVFHVGGRVGAVKGPAVFRRAFARLKEREGVVLGCVDAGDVPGLAGDIAVNHLKASEFVKAAHLKTGLSVVIGGGHDHGYSHLLGVSQALAGQSKKKIRLGCINIDAHLDVRNATPVATSGSPFFLAIESGVIEPSRLVEFGIQGQCNAPELWKYVEDRKVEVVSMRKLREAARSGFRKALKRLASRSDAVVISLDLDAVAGAFAPGVSAPQPEGFTPSEIFAFLEESGSSKKVVSLGIFELNPEHDPDGRTARLAAVAAYSFVAAKLG